MGENEDGIDDWCVFGHYPFLLMYPSRSGLCRDLPWLFEGRDTNFVRHVGLLFEWMWFTNMYPTVKKVLNVGACIFPSPNKKFQRLIYHLVPSISIQRARVRKPTGSLSSDPTPLTSNNSFITDTDSYLRLILWNRHTSPLLMSC